MEAYGISQKTGVLRFHHVGGKLVKLNINIKRGIVCQLGCKLRKITGDAHETVEITDLFRCTFLYGVCRRG